MWHAVIGLSLSLSLFLCPISGFRVTAKIVQGDAAATSFDIVSCDQMCMQCPDGKRNVLIQRQKTGKANIVGAGLGMASFGWGTAATTQLAGCTMIGFELWHNRELEREQPWRTTAWLGYLYVKPGLDALEEESLVDVEEEAHVEDLRAIEACKKLSGSYLFQGHEEQKANANVCLSHSQLCGVTTGEQSQGLNVDRWGLFNDEKMCTPTREDEVDANELDTVDEGTNINNHGHVDPLDVSSHEKVHSTTIVDTGNNVDMHELGGTVDGGSNLDNDSLVDPVKASGHLAGLKSTTVDGQGVDNGRQETVNPKANAVHRIKRVPTKDATETIIEAGHLLENGITNDGQGTNGELELSDTGIGAEINALCRSEDQVERCKREGRSSGCRDWCCISICKAYANRLPSCVRTCVRNGM